MRYPTDFGNKLFEQPSCIPWKSKDYILNRISVKTIVLVRVYNQQFQGTILLMVFEPRYISIYNICIGLSPF